MSPFKLRAQARGLVLPDDNDDATQTGPVVWDGRAFVLAKEGEHGAREAFTYCHGQRMVGQAEQPCASTTKLVAGRHRFINAPDNSKKGFLWRPGNRYTHRVRTHTAPVRSAYLAMTPSPYLHPVLLYARVLSCCQVQRSRSAPMTVSESVLQNLKIDTNIDGEAVLSAGRFVPYLCDTEGLSYKSGPLMWSEHRFRDVPGQMGHADYEAMCDRLAKTTRWDRSRPPAQCEPGHAAYTRRPSELQAQRDVVRCRARANAVLPCVALLVACVCSTAAGTQTATQAVRNAISSLGLTEHRNCPSDLRRVMQGAQQPPTGTRTLTESTGERTIVPDTAHLAPEHGATLLVPARRGVVPNGPAAFAVHKTPQADLRWLTRVTSQRTSGNVPTKGPGDVPYFEAQCPTFGESRGCVAATGLERG